jgi:hypothetical protein
LAEVLEAIQATIDLAQRSQQLRFEFRRLDIKSVSAEKFAPSMGRKLLTNPMNLREERFTRDVRTN